MSSTTWAAAESRRNVVPLDNTQLAPEALTSQKPLLYLWCDYWAHYSARCQVWGGGPGTTSVSELSAAPILFSWPELEDWQCYSHVTAVAWNTCHTIIAPSFIPPDTAGGAFNCSFGAGVWSLQVPACQMDTASSA